MALQFAIASLEAIRSAKELSRSRRRFSLERLPEDAFLANAVVRVTRRVVCAVVLLQSRDSVNRKETMRKKTIAKRGFANSFKG